MHAVDLTIVAVYLIAMVGVGLWFSRRHSDANSYFVGDRKMGAGHLGLSVVATDVGGGFSIGLGGLGFTMGISGSWLLFSGLLGAWITAVVLIPRIKTLGDRLGWTTFPDFLEHRFDSRMRLVAALVSALGYAAFVGAQILAGAKLAAGAFQIDLHLAVAGMAVVIVAYTSLGGLQAVVFTDTIQWIVLLGGLLLVALPAAWSAAGGLEGIRQALPESHFSLTNVTWQQATTWVVAIVPIWFVGNTLYQRIYAARDERTARRAWYLAGLLEWPLMAFVGTLLGLLGRVLLPHLGADQAEMALPILLREVLPIGVVGVVMAAYLSAIMSTADSCLLASVGHLVSDVYRRHMAPKAPEKRLLRLSRVLTVVVGIASVVVALVFPRVMDAILLAYSFMVSGLFVPTLAGLLWKRATTRAAFWSMVVGGSLAVVLHAFPDILPSMFAGVDPALFAIPAAALVLVALTLAIPDSRRKSTA